MSFEKIFNNTSLLKNVQVKIDDFVVPKDDVLTIETKYDFFNFPIITTLKIKDSFDMFNYQIKPKEKNLITISLTDITDEKIHKTFIITDYVVNMSNERFKVVTIHGVDEISYILNTSYISKSFNDTPVSAFKQYVDNIKLSDIMTKNKISIDDNDTSESTNFVVPQNESVLDFFLYQLSKENIRMWQDKKNIHIKEVKPSTLPIAKGPNGDLIFKNNTLNNEYIAKIHEIQMTINASGHLNLVKPIDEIYKFSTDKTIVSETINIKDYASELKLNNFDSSSLQITNGTRFNTNELITDGFQKYQLFNSYMLNNETSIVTAGSLKYSNVGTIVKVELKGNPLFEESTLKGDEFSSGKYFVSSVVDKIIGDKLMQKYTLNRIDFMTKG